MNQNAASNKNEGKKALSVWQEGGNVGELITVSKDVPDTISQWAAGYFRYEVTTSERSQAEQRRDLKTFIEFMFNEEGTDDRVVWSPRLSRAFLDHLKNATHQAGPRVGQRRWSDRTINRVLAHLKTFARWIHKIRPFPLGNPMEKLKTLQAGASLDIERALTSSERRRLLDAADLLLSVRGRSRDRRRNRQSGKRPCRKG